MGNPKYDFGVALSGKTSIPNFMKIHAAIVELKHADRQKRTDSMSPICLHFMHNVQITYKKGSGAEFVVKRV
jgi:hypothetical protein